MPHNATSLALVGTTAIDPRVHPRLRPARQAVTTQWLALLFAGQPKDRAGDAADLRMAAYLLALEEFSPEAIEAGIREILKGKSGQEAKWCPTAGETAIICRRHKYRIAEEIEREKRRNTPRLAEPEYRPSPEEAARIAEKARKASELLKAATEAMTMPVERKQSAAERQRAVEDIAKEAAAVVAEAARVP
jgi:hypothetical protein